MNHTVEKFDVEELSKTLRKFEFSVVGKEGNSPLRHAWHFLQVYATWGTRLPSDETMLKYSMGIDNPGEYDFFMPMLDGYSDLSNACGIFLTNVFGGVVAVGQKARQFAKEAGGESDGIFSAVTELMDAGDEESMHAVVELLTDLQQQAKDNAEQASQVTSQLAAFKVKLESTNAKLKEVRVSVEEDSRTSQATIDKLSGGEDAAGSIKDLNKRIAAKRDEYKHNVVVASTTTTYFWVAPPAGLIAAVTVASIFGTRATETLNAIDTLEENLKNATSELRTAVESQKVQNSAEMALGETTHFTALAIEHTTTVQQAWSEISASLDVVRDKVTSMTTSNDEGVVARSKIIVKLYAKQASKAWSALIEPLEELVRDPYITVQQDAIDWKELGDNVESELKEEVA